MSSNGYRDILQTLIDRKDLTDEQAHGVFTELMDGQLSEAQIAGLLIALRTKGECVAEIAGAARAMREHAVKIDVGGADVIDIVGTGGTGLKTFNISTTSCFVAAGAGAKVAKHGNVTNTRASGAADILSALGVNLQATPETVSRCIANAGVGFCFARACHPAMKYAAPVRKQLPVRTIFNVLGPLTNPAGANRMILGAFADEWTEPLAEVLGRLGVVHAWVVHAGDGLDEITNTTTTRVSEIRNGKVRTWTMQPEDADLPRGALKDLLVTDPNESAAVAQAVLDGKKGSPRNIVLLNVAAALVVADLAKDLKDGVAKAEASIDSGAAKAALGRMVKESNA
ncbi:MAG: anthranilate phosphoribosyltransferase [Phycisphaerae bacterium]|nr:anthranilate phosphoribosyltransferase [Phycisphaerae bacterium]